MRKVKLGRCPDALKAPGSLGERELAEVDAYYAMPANRGTKYPGTFRAYKERSVKATINAAFFFKCAYCESRYAHLHPVDVEHYRPKAAVKVAGSVREFGYPWLAAKWENLLASCIFCNREQVQAFPDGSARKSGKGENFPIVDEAARATAKDEERKEGRLLLNPYLDNPNVHLSFDEEGLVRPARSRSGRQSRKGRVSIEVLGLLRQPLVDRRAAVAKDVVARMESIERLMRVEERTRDAELREQIREDMSALKGRLEEDQEYTTMVRQLAGPFVERLEAWRGER
jgi:uncharacterized protein (TIGR02646 family)